MPPNDEPPMHTPEAKARRRWNQWLSTAMEMVLMMVQPTPPHTLRLSMNCQYSRHCANAMNDMKLRAAPHTSRYRGP